MVASARTLGRRPARTECKPNKAGMPLFALFFEEKYPINRTHTARVHTSKRGAPN